MFETVLSWEIYPPLGYGSYRSLNQATGEDPQSVTLFYQMGITRPVTL